MGVDVYGKNAISETGKYFRNNWWWWRPLWLYCKVAAPKIVTEELYEKACYNSGNLDSKEAAKLGVILQTKIAEGHTKVWKNERDLYLESLPDENCSRCNNNNRGHNKKKDCKVCGNKGTTENWDKHYPFNVDNVENFADFCINSGGFEIC